MKLVVPAVFTRGHLWFVVCLEQRVAKMSGKIVSIALMIFVAVLLLVAIHLYAPSSAFGPLQLSAFAMVTVGTVGLTLLVAGQAAFSHRALGIADVSLLLGVQYIGLGMLLDGLLPVLPMVLMAVGLVNVLLFVGSKLLGWAAKHRS